MLLEETKCIQRGNEMGVALSSKGNWTKTKDFLSKTMSMSKMEKAVLDSCGKRGVEALELATPADSGITAKSWSYDVSIADGLVTLSWSNSSKGKDWFPIAIMLQYGHGTGTGGYVQGIDYINPALKPIFDEIAETVWEAVTTS